MYKITTLALALTVLGTGIIATTNASRDAYHAYLTSEKATTSRMYYTDALGIKNQSTGLHGSSAHYQNRYSRAIRNLRYSQANTRYTYTRRDVTQRPTSPQKPTRTISRSTAPWQKSFSRSSIPVAKNVSVEGVKFTTYENKNFSIQLPNGWTNQGTNTQVFTKKNHDLAVKIKRFEAGTCTGTGFMGCAIQLGISENETAVPGNGQMYVTSSITRLAQKSDTVLNQVNVSTNTYNERFNAILPKQSEKNITRFFIEDQDGAVFMIEVTSEYQNAAKYVGVTKQIFDSFRIYPEA